MGLSPYCRELFFPLQMNIYNFFRTQAKLSFKIINFFHIVELKHEDDIDDTTKQLKKF